MSKGCYTQLAKTIKVTIVRQKTTAPFHHFPSLLGFKIFVIYQYLQQSFLQYDRVAHLPKIRSNIFMKCKW